MTGFMLLILSPFVFWGVRSRILLYLTMVAWGIVNYMYVNDRCQNYTLRLVSLVIVPFGGIITIVFLCYIALLDPPIPNDD